MRCSSMFAAALSAALGGCVTLPDSVAREFAPAAADERQSLVRQGTVEARPAPARPRRNVDASRLPLANGQIIVSETGGAMSLVYSLFAAEFAPWVHAGIVAVEGAEVVVYEAQGALIPVPGVSPTATISGSVRRSSVADFVRGKRIVGLYDLPAAADRERVVAFAREHYRRRTPFDPFFDSDDANALYCTELVALALADAGMTIEPTPVRHNRSLAVAREWLAMRSRSVYLAGRLVEPGLQAGRWSPDLSPLQIDAYFAAKRELHRRFDASARLGHAFAWTGMAVRLRESIAAFMEAAIGAAADPALDAAALPGRVDQLAALHLGPAPSGEASPELALGRPGEESARGAP